MTRDQVALLLAKASAAFSNSAPDFRKDPQIFEVWVEMLYDFDAQTALNNLNKHIKASTFFPAIADIVKAEKETRIGEYVSAAETQERIALMDEWERDAVDPPARLLQRNRKKADLQGGDET